ncbi:MAG: hypothetical protein ACREIC_23735 [Limisphaerales bacterium]
MPFWAAAASICLSVSAESRTVRVLLSVTMSDIMQNVLHPLPPLQAKYLGLAVGSRDNMTLCTTTFDNVSAPGWPSSAAGPTGLTAMATPGGQANLTWNALANATSYNVKRSTLNGGPYSA